MLVFPYDTTICRSHRVGEIEKKVARAQIEYPLPALTTPMGNVIKDALFVTPKDEYDDVPSFSQIITLDTGKSTQFVIDARPYMRWDRRSDTYRLTAENDFGFQCGKVALTQILAEQGSAPFHKFGDIPVKTFIRWVVLAIAQRFGLPLEAQIRMMVICAYYYFTQLEPNRVLTAESKQMLVNRVARITSVPGPMVMEIADVLGSLSDAGDLAAALVNHGGTVRLGDFKFVDLYTLISPSWVGINARENTGVALEHIPTFIAMVYTGLGDRSYRKTMITRRAETAGRQADFKLFIDQVYRQVESRFV